MNKETFIKRLSPILTVKNAIPVRYYTAFAYLERMTKGEKIRPFSWSRSRGRYTLCGENDAYYLLEICDLLKIELQNGNDSPKFGKEKEYFYLNPSDRRKLKGINFGELQK